MKTENLSRIKKFLTDTINDVETTPEEKTTNPHSRGFRSGLKSGSLIIAKRTVEFIESIERE